MVSTNLENFLTVAEVASILHIHTNTLRRWSDTGKIKFIRISDRGDRRYRLQDVLNFLDECIPDKES